MKKLLVLAALLTITTAAQAGNSISFQIEGHRIRIEAPRNCDSLSCIQISAPSLSSSSLSSSSISGSSISGSGFGFKGGKSKRFDDDADFVERDAPVEKSAPAPVAAAPAPTAAPAPVAAAPAPAVVASTSPAPVMNDIAPAAPQPAPVAAVPAPTSPLGIWATEENKGNVRIELCGANLCGYAVKTGEKILINMKPSDTKWTGQIHDPDSGRNYDSTIALKGTNFLRVQGCAFGGMFCGGQTWKRVS